MAEKVCRGGGWENGGKGQEEVYRFRGTLVAGVDGKAERKKDGRYVGDWHEGTGTETEGGGQ